MTLQLAREDVARVVASLGAAVLGLGPAESAPAAAELDSFARLELAAATGTFFGLDATGHEELLLRARTQEAWIDAVLAGWAAGPRELTFATSGTTGPPRLCTHPWEAIAQEVEVLAAIAGPSRCRIAGLVPHHHIYGLLFCVLLPRRLGLPLIDARAAGPAAARSGDLVVGFPLRWELAAQTGHRVPPDVWGVTSTGPIQAATVERLAGLGLARMVEVYGSSETGGIAWRDDPYAPLTLMPHWRLRADGDLERTPPGGGVARVAPPDRLAVVEGGIVVLGRRDGAVQVGGVNVSCDHVAAVLRGHPRVHDCAVRPMRQGEGRRLKAFVVGAPADAPELRHWIAGALSPPERPTSLTFGAALPRDAQGKPADWEAG